jgi:hypothetical protein
MIESAEHRSKFHLVGLNHEIHYWGTPHGAFPEPFDNWQREYDPGELFDSESWIINVNLAMKLLIIRCFIPFHFLCLFVCLFVLFLFFCSSLSRCGSPFLMGDPLFSSS